jgi:hypothetical protein
LPSGSSNWICFPPGPDSISFRKRSPVFFNASTLAGKSSTARIIRFDARCQWTAKNASSERQTSENAADQAIASGDSVFARVVGFVYPGEYLGKSFRGFGAEDIVIGGPDDAVAGEGGTVLFEPTEDRPGGDDWIDRAGEKINRAGEVTDDFARVILRDEFEAMSDRGEAFAGASVNKFCDGGLGFGRVPVAEVSVPGVDEENDFPELVWEELDDAFSDRC